MDQRLNASTANNDNNTAEEPLKAGANDKSDTKVPMVIVEDKTSRSASPRDNCFSIGFFRNDDDENISQEAPTRFLTKTVSAQSQQSTAATPTDDVSCGGESLEESNILPDGDFQSTLSVSEYPDCFRGETIVDHLPVPPDGGYGWVIVLAAFVSNVIVDGIANSFGPFMAPYQASFQSSKAMTSFIGSLLVGAYLLSGPLAGGLLNKYEARRVVIAGALLSSVSFVLSTFSPNVITHCFFYGLLGGTGFAFIYLPAIVTVSQYFERRRALATGVSVAGSGVGTFIMPLLCKNLIEVFNWKVTLYVLAALVLICAICALFYKPLPVPEDQIQLNEELKRKALLAALSRADFSEDDDESSSKSSRGSNEDRDNDVSPSRRDTRRTNSQCTNRTLQRGNGDDSLPLLNLMEHAPSHDNDSEQAAEVGDEEAGGRATAGSPTPQPGTSHVIRPSQLSPITEARNGVIGVVSRGSRANSQHHYHHHSPGVVNGAARFPIVVRNRKTTLTSMNSEFTSMANGMDFRQSRPNLTGQLSRISARSYAQSLSRISQGPHSIKAGDSILSVALSGVDPKEFNRPMSRRDVFLQGSIKNLKEFEDEGCNYKAYREQRSVFIPASVVAQSLTKLSIAAQAHGDIADLSSRMGGSRYSRMTGGFATEEEELANAFVDDSKFKWIPFPIRNVFSEMIDINLLREPVMLMLCLSNIFGMVGFYVPFVFVIDLALEKNVDASQATLLLSIIGITNTFGRVMFGWMADRQWVSALVLNNWSLLVCGLLTAICPLAPNFTWLVVYAALFGFVISAYICLTSIVLSDLLGVERLTNSFGLLVVSRGIASLVGTPVAGIVYDVTRSYNTAFYVSGSLIVLAGLTSCLIPVLHRYERSKYKNEGDYHPQLKIGNGADADIEVQSGKLSVLTERSEENLTEYQRTIQSIAQQKQLIRELEEYKSAARQQRNKTGAKLPNGDGGSMTRTNSNQKSGDEKIKMAVKAAGADN